MTRTLILGAAALALSVGAALAQAPNQVVYPNAGYGYGYASTAYAAPAYGGYAGPSYGATYGQPLKRVQTGQQQPQQPQW